MRLAANGPDLVLYRRVGNGNNAPGLHIAGGGCRLGGGDEQIQGFAGNLLVEVVPATPVADDGFACLVQRSGGGQCSGVPLVQWAARVHWAISKMMLNMFGRYSGRLPTNW